MSLQTASTIVDAALPLGAPHGFMPLSVAVLDPGGHLVAFKREDRSGILRFDIAFGKAWGALGMGFGSRELFNRTNANPTFMAALTTVSGGRLGAGAERRTDPVRRRRDRGGRRVRRQLRQ